MNSCSIDNIRLLDATSPVGDLNIPNKCGIRYNWQRNFVKKLSRESRIYQFEERSLLHVYFLDNWEFRKK